MYFGKKFWLQRHFFIPLILVVLGIILNGYAVVRLTSHSSNKPSEPTQLPTSQLTETLPSPISLSTNSPVISATEIKLATTKEPKFGHFPYPEGDAKKMAVIASYAQGEYQRFERLAPDMALAFMKLIYAARDENVWIIPVSGYRTFADQDKLFKAQIKKRGSVEAAVKLSAPPGYSEHQTGYAIDLSDGHFPKQDITYNFAQTDAFHWLSTHGKDFGFELSFPENNIQGVSYEPWHWRFIGSPEALNIFQRAKNSAPQNRQPLKNNLTNKPDKYTP